MMAAQSIALNGNSSSSTNHPRHDYARAILGAELFAKLSSSKILVVGAGGIGCELLKNLVLVGFGHIEVIDLDTIDLSNLNRQFLFQKMHIGKAKSIVAAGTALNFNPNVKIIPHHANVKDTTRFGWEFFEQFDVVCNALDNLDARRWVNKMCIMTNVPLVESGTTGFLGQVQPIAKSVSECYDCTAKPTPKTYPVCTIRSTPSTSIHCIVWSKTYLFPQLFGAEAENEDAELDKALQDGENAKEIANLRKEAQEMRTLRDAIWTAGNDEKDLARRVFNKVFKHDIERLLGMEEMWANRTKPDPIDYDVAVRQGENGGATANGNANGASSTTLRDQRILSLTETTALFADSLLRLSKRTATVKKTEGLSFDKDDVDAMDFVTAASNLRSTIYHISTQSRFQVKEMAGNIIPAIASTNAIIAGAQVLQTLYALRRNWQQARFVALNRANAVGSRLVSSSALGTPNRQCGVCQDDFVRARVDVEAVTLGDIKQAILKPRNQGGIGCEVSGIELYEGARLLADEDFDDNLERSLESLGISPGMMISCVDEDGVWATLNVYISSAAPNSDVAVDFGDASRLPTLRHKPVVVKKPADESDDGDVIEEVDPASLPAVPAPSTNKRKRLAQDAVNGKEETNGNSAEKRQKMAVNTGANEGSAIELD